MAVGEKFAADYFFYARVIAVSSVLLSLGGKQLLLKYTINNEQLRKPIFLLFVVSVLLALIFHKHSYLFFAVSCNITSLAIGAIYIGNMKANVGTFIESVFSNLTLVLLLFLFQNLDIQFLFFIGKALPLLFILFYIYLFPVESKRLEIDRKVQKRIYSQNVIQSFSKNSDAFLVRTLFDSQFQMFYHIALQFSAVLNLLQETNNTILINAIKVKDILTIKVNVRKLVYTGIIASIFMFYYRELILNIVWSLETPIFFTQIFLVVLLSYIINMAIGPIELFMNLNGMDKAGVYIKLIALIVVSVLGWVVWMDIWHRAYLILISSTIIADNLLRRLFLIKSKEDSIGII